VVEAASQSSYSTAPPDSTGRVRRNARRLFAGVIGVGVFYAILVPLYLSVDRQMAAAIAVALLSVTVVGSLLALFATRRIVVAVGEVEHDRDTLERLYNRARMDALRDPLTGLGNHRAFQEELERRLDEARRYKHPFALILMDLDDLKLVNDQRGHAAGDALISSMGRLIAHGTRSVDRGFRVGGDEFALLMPGVDADEALVVARRILASALAASESRGDWPFSFSAGVSAVPAPSGDGRRLYHHADAALYWAKRHGRTDVEIFDPTRHGAYGDDRPVAELGAAIGRVIERRMLRPAYQAIVDLDTGRPKGFEGLVRPLGLEFQDVSSLFRAAEATDRSVELDLACLEAVASGATDMPQDAYLSVNLSPPTLEAKLFRPNDLLAVLARNGIPPRRTVVEVTEREHVEDFEQLRRNLEGCRALGMRIAIDDVGAGYAGLRLLSEIHFDIVKIDLSLVQGGVHRSTSLAVIRAVQDLARDAGSFVVAEGIETGDQLELVRSLGIPAGQGYLLSRPAAEPKAPDLDLEELITAFATVRADVVGAT
jgi:diguanylate cyclase (GGDEF)-like protein